MITNKSTNDVLHKNLDYLMKPLKAANNDIKNADGWSSKPETQGAAKINYQIKTIIAVHISENLNL